MAHGTACLGPVTQAGCGVLCPSYNRGCYGCCRLCKRCMCRKKLHVLEQDALDDDKLHHELAER